jgi:hypothetical protein
MPVLFNASSLAILSECNAKILTKSNACGLSKTAASGALRIGELLGIDTPILIVQRQSVPI